MREMAVSQGGAYASKKGDLSHYMQASYDVIIAWAYIIVYG